MRLDSMFQKRIFDEHVNGFYDFAPEPRGIRMHRSDLNSILRAQRWTAGRANSLILGPPVLRIHHCRLRFAWSMLPIPVGTCTVSQNSFPNERTTYRQPPQNSSPAPSSFFRTSLH